MLENCNYDKVKLLHELSCMVWFIQKHAKKNATDAGDAQCLEALEQLQADLDAHIEKLKEIL